MIDAIKNEIYIQLQFLFAELAINEMTMDTAAYNTVVEKINAIASVLGINTEVDKYSVSTVSPVCD
jgi:hypothetical protein